MKGSNLYAYAVFLRSFYVGHSAYASPALHGINIHHVEAAGAMNGKKS